LKKLLFTALSVSILMCFAVAPSRAEKLVVVIPMLMNTGSPIGDKGGVDNTSSFLTRICDIIKKKTGDDAECVTVNRPNDATLTPQNLKKYIQSIDSKDYSVMYISGTDYYSFLASGYDKAVPAATISFKKKKVDMACIFTRAADGYKSLDDLRGKTWAGSYFYMGTRYVLYKNGIDVPLKQFFGKLDFEQNDAWLNLADGLLAGNYDVFTGSMEEEIMGRARDKRYAAIKTLACEPHRSTHLIIFNKANLSKEKMTQIRNMLLNAHKDKDFGPFQFIFAIIDGHFVPFDEEAFKINKEFVDTSVSRGWLKEQISFVSGK